MPSMGSYGSEIFLESANFATVPWMQSAIVSSVVQLMILTFSWLVRKPESASTLLRMTPLKKHVLSLCSTSLQKVVLVSPHGLSHTPVTWRFLLISRMQLPSWKTKKRTNSSLSTSLSSILKLVRTNSVAVSKEITAAMRTSMLGDRYNKRRYYRVKTLAFWLLSLFPFSLLWL